MPIFLPGAGGTFPGGNTQPGTNAPSQQGSFCERHRTTCGFGSWIKDRLGGGCRQRSSCWTVTAGDDERAFIEGRIAQYKVWATTDAIAKGLGLTVKDVEETFTYAERARIHINAFVPLCQGLEDGRLTCDINDTYGKGIRSTAYYLFQEKVRAGQIDLASAAGNNDRSGGDSGGGTGEGGKGGSNWSGTANPLLAGFGSTTGIVAIVVAVAAIAVLAARSK